MADYNFSAYVVAALAGNSWRESHINPTVQQAGGSAFGLFQWDGSRKTNLLNWLSENGFSDTNPYGQMEYLVVEDDWLGAYDGISSLQEFLNSPSTNITSLTTAFCLCWERPGNPELDERIEFANKALEYIFLHASDENITEWETEPMYYLSENQALNNAVLMYRFYRGGTIKKKSKFPLWMYLKYHY